VLNVRYTGAVIGVDVAGILGDEWADPGGLVLGKGWVHGGWA